MGKGVVRRRYEPPRPTNEYTQVPLGTAAPTRDKSVPPTPLLDGGEGKTLNIKTNLTQTIPLVPEHNDRHDATLHLTPHGAAARTATDVTTPPLVVHTPSQLRLHSENITAACGSSIMAQSPIHTHHMGIMDNLLPPRLADGTTVTGETTHHLRKWNKGIRQHKLADQPEDIKWWTTHKGNFVMPSIDTTRPKHLNNMCPTGLALHHPAAQILTEYAMLGCPTETGKPWTKEQMQAAIDRGPHKSALQPDAITQLYEEVQEKVKLGQARIVSWDDIKDDPPPELKISPLAMIPHNSRMFRAILDLSFPIKLSDGTIIPSVNSTTTKTAPRGAINQIGHSLQRIIHAFATADPDAKIFMAKWDIKDGFWRLDCERGQEWNFCYVLPTLDNEPIQLVVPTSLQMGWIESPPYFCTASETARDVAEQYLQLPIGTLPTHKFTHKTERHPEAQALQHSEETAPLKFLLEVYMDDYIGLAIPTSLAQLRHYSNAVMFGIHDVFPPDTNNDTDPISNKKLEKLDGSWAHEKDILGLTFDGIHKTVWLEESKRNALITILTGWLRAGKDKRFGIPFNEVESVVAKVRHAFTTIPAGLGLMSRFNTILRKKPARVFLHRNKELQLAISECRTFLRESVSHPTKCASLVTAWPDYIGLTDASSFGAGGVILGENRDAPLTVFWVQWPQDITDAVISETNPNGTLTNNDLEMAGLLLLWLAIEEVCTDVNGSHVALFSDNTPTVGWVARMASKRSTIAMQLLRALALRLQLTKASPLTPLHIAGIDNAMADIPSRSFGSEPRWTCRTDTDLFTLFTTLFPPPPQTSWNVFQHSSAICTKVISALRMQASTTDDWRRLPRNGSFIGPIGPTTSHLYNWTLTFREHHIQRKSKLSQDLQDEFEQDTMAGDAQLQLQRSIRLSQPLERRSPWPLERTQRN